MKTDKENEVNSIEQIKRKEEYNQRLLKSLERKTLKDTVAAISQPAFSKYR